MNLINHQSQGFNSYYGPAPAAADSVRTAGLPDSMVHSPGEELHGSKIQAGAEWKKNSNETHACVANHTYHQFVGRFPGQYHTKDTEPAAKSDRHSDRLW